MAGEAHSELRETAVAYQTASDFPALHDPRYPVHRVAEWLEPYLRVIVERFHPERVILFGSYVYGQPDRHSDFDLLIIRRNIPSEKASNLEIANAFWDVPGPRPSFTILSKTPDRIAERLAVKSPFYEEIVGKGLEVYAAA
jgi:predicted nucleotidyltransferase